MEAEGTAHVGAGVSDRAKLLTNDRVKLPR